MENLTEQTLLGELKIRFMRNVIYTYVGEILVTVNPFKWIDGSFLLVFCFLCFLFLISKPQASMARVFPGRT